MVKNKLHRHRPQIEKVGTDGSQRGNQRSPWQGTAGSQMLELMLPNLGTIGYHYKCSNSWGRRGAVELGRAPCSDWKVCSLDYI